MANTKPQALTPEQSAINARSSLMSGVTGDKPDDNGAVPVHVGVAVDVRSSRGVSSLMVPDATRVGEGAPVYLSKPLELDFAKLTKFLGKKGVVVPSAPVNVKELLENTKLACGAFYYCSDKMEVDDQGEKTDKVEKAGTLLMSFSISNKKGLIGSLTGDDDLSELFDVVGVSLRIVKCSEERLPELQRYVDDLLASPQTRALEKDLTQTGEADEEDGKEEQEQEQEQQNKEEEGEG